MATDPSTWKLPRLRIDAEGAWFHDDDEVTHPGILANLRGALSVDGDGHYLPIGPVRVPVEVTDAPFVVLRVESEGDGLALTLNDLSRETLAPDTLRFGARGTPYCRVKAGRFEARLSRPAAYQLLQRVEASAGEGAPSLVLGGRRYPLPDLDADERSR
jgi:uncharacterized protein